jgi:hypothetical protein
MFNNRNEWKTTSGFTLSQAELYDYMGTRLGQAAITIHSPAELVKTIEAGAVSPSRFLLLSREAVTALESYNTGFAIEYNDGDAYSGKLVYKSQNVGGVVFNSSINVLLFDSPGENIGWLAEVKNFRNDPERAGLSIHTIMGEWEEGLIEPLAQTSSILFNDANGRGFLLAKTAAKLLVFVPMPPVEEVPPVVEGIVPQ